MTEQFQQGSSAPQLERGEWRRAARGRRAVACLLFLLPSSRRDARTGDLRVVHHLQRRAFVFVVGGMGVVCIQFIKHMVFVILFDGHLKKRRATGVENRRYSQTYLCVPRRNQVLPDLPLHWRDCGIFFCFWRRLLDQTDEFTTTGENAQK